MKTQINACTQLAFVLNYVIGHRPADLSLREVRTAALQHRLLALLTDRYGHMADFHDLLASISTCQEIESALSLAIGRLEWGKSSRIGISKSGLCLAMAIVLQALRSAITDSWLMEEFKGKQANSKEFKDQISR